MYCRNCGKELPPDANVCPSCGTRVVPEPQGETIFCSHCGQKISKEAIVCPYCGAGTEKYRAQQTQQANAAQPTINVINTNTNTNTNGVAGFGFPFKKKWTAFFPVLVSGWTGHPSVLCWKDRDRNSLSADCRYLWHRRCDRPDRHSLRRFPG